MKRNQKNETSRTSHHTILTLGFESLIGRYRAYRMEKTERNFGHPYEPYQIQNEMMNAIYDCIEKGQIGIFESPTGIENPNGDLTCINMSH